MRSVRERAFTLTERAVHFADRGHIGVADDDPVAGEALANAGPS